MFSHWIMPYHPEGAVEIYFLQPYFLTTPTGRWYLVYCELLSDDMRQVGRWYRENMPVNLCREITVLARQECVSFVATGTTPPVSPVKKKIGL